MKDFEGFSFWKTIVRKKKLLYINKNGDGCDVLELLKT